MPLLEPSPSARTSATPLPTTARRGVTPEDRLATELWKQIDSVLAQVRDVTGNFREIERLDGVRPLPAPVSANVTFLANRGREFRLKLGIEKTLYEYLDEIETIDGLVSVDVMTRALAAKDAPAARKELSTFLTRYTEPRDDERKALWRYLRSAFSLCDRSKTEAEPHLQQARSLESAGKKAEALREYQEIYRIYPNPLTADSIRQLQAQSR